MAKILKILLFSFLIGIVLTIISTGWWGYWDYNDYLPPVAPPGMVIFDFPGGGCDKDGGPLPFFGTCINNEFLNLGIDIIFWSVIVFGFWMLIKFWRGRKRK